MNIMNPETFWLHLREQSAVDGDMPPARVSSPWYVRLMLGFAGWIGALFLLAFVGIGFFFVMENAVAAVLVSMLCCGAAWAAFRFAPDNDVISQFALAVSMAGQGIFLIGMFEAFGSDRMSVFLAAAAYQLVLALLLPNFLHRIIASAAAGVALTFAVPDAGMRMLVPVLLAGVVAAVFLNWRRWACKPAFWSALGYGCLLALIILEFIFRARWGGSFAYRDAMTLPDWWYAYAYLIVEGLAGIVFLCAVARLLGNQGVALTSRAGLAAIGAALLLAVASVWLPGLNVALLILLLGFGCGNRVLQGIGALALLAFLSDFYYSLHATLLFKSGLLAASGGLLLGARLLMHKFFPQDAHAPSDPDATPLAAIDTETSHA